MREKKMYLLISLMLLFSLVFTNTALAYSISSLHRNSYDNNPIFEVDSSFSALGTTGMNAVNWAANQWNAAGSNYQIYVQTTYASQNKIQYGYVSGDAPGETRMISSWWPFTIDYTPITLSSNYSWNNVGTMSYQTKQADLRTVLTHEFGHTIILGHSENTSAVMYPAWVQRWYLTVDDINGVNAVW